MPNIELLLDNIAQIIKTKEKDKSPWIQKLKSKATSASLEAMLIEHTNSKRDFTALRTCLPNSKRQ